MDKECVSLAGLEKDSVQVDLTNVVQDYRGDCQSTELEQTTQVKNKKCSDRSMEMQFPTF